MSASHLKPDIEAFTGYVGFVPQAEVSRLAFFSPKMRSKLSSHRSKIEEPGDEIGLPDRSLRGRRFPPIAAEHRTQFYVGFVPAADIVLNGTLARPRSDQVSKFVAE
jgi:hypothetical protein